MQAAGVSLVSWLMKRDGVSPSSLIDAFFREMHHEIWSWKPAKTLQFYKKLMTSFDSLKNLVKVRLSAPLH